MLKRRQGRAGHRIHVAQGVGRRHGAEVIGPIHDRREEVGGQDQRQVVAQLVDRGIVGRRVTDQHVGVVDRRQAGQQREQVVRRLLGRASARLANWVNRIESRSVMVVSLAVESAVRPRPSSEFTSASPRSYPAPVFTACVIPRPECPLSPFKPARGRSANRYFSPALPAARPRFKMGGTPKTPATKRPSNKA